jgi:hypothetical protein
MTLALKQGYSVSRIEEYSPPHKILNHSSGMGSYTVEFKDGQIGLFSGPLFLPWYFYFFGKKLNCNF